MSYENDHTDAEIARREHNLEMGGNTPAEQRWMDWTAKVEAILGHSLDGDQEQDGYSLDYANDAFDSSMTVEAYVEAVKAAKEQAIDRAFKAERAAEIRMGC